MSLAPGGAAVEAATTATAPTAHSVRTAQRHAAVVSLTTAVVSLANYGFSLVLVRVLAPEDYVHYASVQGLLLVLGTGCMAAVPWAIARHVALSPRGRTAGEALGFGLVSCLVQGVVFAAVCFAVVAPVSGMALATTSAASALSLSLIAAPLGLLQGQQRLVAVSVLRGVETLVRIAVSLLLIGLVSKSPVSPVLGFLAGSVALLALAAVACRDSLPLRRASRATLRSLLRRSASLGAAQVALASLGVIDTVVAAWAHLGDSGASAYQVSALLGRVPVFLASAVAMSYYQGMARAEDDEEVHRELARAVRLLVLLAVPTALLVASCPPVLLDLVSGGRATSVARLLPLTATAGLAVAVTTVLSTVHQARESYRRLLLRLLPVVIAQPVALVVVGRTTDATGFAVTGAALAVTGLALVGADVRRWRPWSGLQRRDVVVLSGLLVLCAGGLVVPWLWLPAAALGALTCLSAIGVDVTRPRARRVPASSIPAPTQHVHQEDTSRG